jgi:hypothetical protein
LVYEFHCPYGIEPARENRRSLYGWDVTFAAVALLCIDVSMLLLVLHVALRLLSDTPGAFARSMLSVPNFGPLFQGRRRRIV